MIAKILDSLINLLKWPTGLLSLCCLVPATMELSNIFTLGLNNLDALGAILSGIIFYIIASRILVGKKRQGWFSTLEHELTHALFALITFHPVTGIKTTDTQGGVIHFTGGNNWLIMVSPYFFPTFSFLCILLFWLLEIENNFTANAILGCTMAYHLISTKHELHKEQTDLQETGFLFSWIFLPGANIISYGMLLSFSFGGVQQLTKYLTNSYQPIMNFLGL